MIVSPGVQQTEQRLDRLLRRVAGRDHDPHRARRGQLLDQLLQRTGARRAVPLGGLDRVGAEVERHDLVLGVAPDPVHHVAAHLAQPDEPDLHGLVSSS